MPIVRRFHSSIVSSRQVATEISNLVSGSNAEPSGRSSAAPLTSNRPIRKRAKNADRREMLESFVNKYRAMNLGKFPSPTTAQKEVGGGYYSIKKMLQEMEYNFKISLVEKGATKENKKQIKGDDALNQEIAMESSGSQEKSNSQITIDQKICEDPWVESGSNFDKKTYTGNNNVKGDDALSQEIAIESSGTGNNNVKVDDALSQEIAIESPESQEKSNGQITIDQNLCDDPWVESGSNFDKNTYSRNNNVKGDDGLSHEIAMESSGSREKSNDQIAGHQNLCEDPRLESGSNFDKNTCTGSNNDTRDDTHNVATESGEKPEQNPRDDDFAFKDSESKVEKKHDGIRNKTRDDGEKDNELREKASLWGNLKSLANNFMNMWKK